MQHVHSQHHSPNKIYCRVAHSAWPLSGEYRYVTCLFVCHPLTTFRTILGSPCATECYHGDPFRLPWGYAWSIESSLGDKFGSLGAHRDHRRLHLGSFPILESATGYQFGARWVHWAPVGTHEGIVCVLCQGIRNKEHQI